MIPSEPFADERTLEAIDFAEVRAMVVAATRTQRGRALVTALKPDANPRAIRLEQARTGAARDLLVAADLHVLPAVDTAAATQAAAQGRTLSLADLRAVADALAAAAAAHRAVRESAVLRELAAPFTPQTEVASAILEAIDERGEIADRASPALGRIRRSLAQAQSDARDRATAALRSAKFAKAIQDHVVTLREDRFVVPIKAEFAGEVAGIVHDTSASGQTVFIEPLASLASNNRVRTLRIEEEREIARILEALSASVGARSEAIERNVEVLAAIDALVAKARVAHAMDAIAPELSEEALVRIVRGRHPLLGAHAVAQSLALDDDARAIVISGPNMGGKTVTLKMLGLFVAMTYCGLQIPAAAGTTIGTYARLIVDIGDEQSIASNASTFSAHLARLRELLDFADARTLALVDEIGGGTEPSAGAALAIAILERLLARGTSAVVTTHATELKLFAHAHPGVRNASVRFDAETFAPTFALDVGMPGQSMAFPLALRMGIDASVVARAQGLVEGRERDYEAALAELAVRSSELQRARERAGGEAARLAAEREALAGARAATESAQRAFLAQAEERMAQALRDFIAELRARPSARPRVTPAQTGALHRTLDALRDDLSLRDEPPPASLTDTLAVDTPVRSRSLRQDAVVVEDFGETVLLAIGPMKTVVRKSDLERREASAGRRRARGQSTAAARLEAATHSSGELDVRGRRYVDAEPLVEQWLDAALLAGSSRLRLIHGKGTGMLGRGLQEYLRGHPAVASVRYGSEDEGSSGVSVIELRA